MSAALPPQAFDLLETMKWTPDGGFFLLDRHLHRLTRSAQYFDYVCSTSDLRRTLNAAVAKSEGPLRVRLLLARDGSVRLECSPLEPTTSPARLAVAQAPVDPSDVFLFHKTTNRTQYDQAKRANAVADDVILWNPTGQVTESTLGNVVAEIGGRKLTPPVTCGLLAGTFREQLLEEGVIEEGVITIADLRAASRVWLVNSVREWWPAALADGDASYRAAAIASTPTSASATMPHDANRSQR
jgi:branched-subunit amino acid aminotransferase/4-amino-4-deoxychorismate lyase